MGGERVTVKNLDVIGVDPDQNLIWLRGCVPGHPNGTVLIRKNG
jgi:large subunit ribosomal protein L3